MEKTSVKKAAFTFILLMGIISLFSDMTHEGASSIIGAYLGMLGASAAVIGFVSGLGECIGYSLRLLTGWITDKTHKYWPMTIIGYIIDCVCIPALALDLGLHAHRDPADRQGHQKAGQGYAALFCGGSERNRQELCYPGISRSDRCFSGTGVPVPGAALWGIGMGAQESILKAAVTEIVPKENRSSGFGIFQTAFGVCWFLGSWLMGILYETSMPGMVIFSVVMQLAAIPLFWMAGKTQKKTGALQEK